MAASGSGNCPICGAYAQTLERHHRRHHLPSDDAYECDACSHMTRYPEDMERHLYRVHRGRDNVRYIQRYIRGGYTKMFRCHFINCHWCSISLTSVNRHVVSAHHNQWTNLDPPKDIPMTSPRNYSAASSEMGESPMTTNEIHAQLDSRLRRSVSNITSNFETQNYQNVPPPPGINLDTERSDGACGEGSSFGQPFSVMERNRREMAAFAARHTPQDQPILSIQPERTFEDTEAVRTQVYSRGARPKTNNSLFASTTPKAQSNIELTNTTTHSRITRTVSATDNKVKVLPNIRPAFQNLKIAALDSETTVKPDPMVNHIKTIYKTFPQYMGIVMNIDPKVAKLCGRVGFDRIPVEGHYTLTSPYHQTLDLWICSDLDVLSVQVHDPTTTRDIRIRPPATAKIIAQVLDYHILPKVIVAVAVFSDEPKANAYFATAEEAGETTQLRFDSKFGFDPLY